MKNFPHQYNDLTKLGGTLAMATDQADNGVDVADDATLGYALARAGIYTFRKTATSPAPRSPAEIEARITAEQTQPKSNQGAMTAAREMRRTLGYLGWFDRDHGTDLGRAVIALGADSDEARAIVQASMTDIEVEADGKVSHPMRVLLKLIDEVEFTARDGMELALEAEDDTDAEFDRIRALALLSKGDRHAEYKKMGIKESQIPNAVKILPAFALQARLIEQDAAGRFRLTADGRGALARAGGDGPIGVAPEQISKPAQARRKRGRPAPSKPGDVGRAPGGGTRRHLSEEEQRDAARLLLERTTTHQGMVRTLAAEHSGRAKIFENPFSYDLIFDSADLPIALVEVKSINGDVAAQVRHAVGQLHYYEFFDAAPNWPDRGIVKIAVFDDEIDPDHCDYMTHTGVAAVRLHDDGTLEGLNDLALDALELIESFT